MGMAKCTMIRQSHVMFLYGRGCCAVKMRNNDSAKFSTLSYLDAV